MIGLAEIELVIGEMADATDLAAFAARSFAEAFAADNDPDDLADHLRANYGTRQQAAELQDPSVTTILARWHGELVAYAQVRKNPSPPFCVPHRDPIELHRFYVDRRAHGSGLAYRLMEEVHRAADAFQGRHLWLGVWERNPRAIAFYKKAGFSDVGQKIYMVGTDRQVDRVLVTAVDPRWTHDRSEI